MAGWRSGALRRAAGAPERETSGSRLRRFAEALDSAAIDVPAQAVGRFPHAPIDFAAGTMEPHPHAAVHAWAHSPELADAMRAVGSQRRAALDG